MADATNENFTLGTPALICRWRLAGGALPLMGRHIRAFKNRQVGGSPLSGPLVAWTKQHLEWTLAEGTTEHPDGTLMVVVDTAGNAAMTAGPYEPLAQPTAAQLIARAADSRREAATTGIAPETLWLVTGESLTVGAEPEEALGGTASFIVDLARALDVPVTRSATVAREAAAGTAAYDQLFLASDEHGIVLPAGAPDGLATKIKDAYATLLEKTREQAHRRPQA